MKEFTRHEDAIGVSSAVMAPRHRKALAEEIAELLAVLPPGAAIRMEDGHPIIVPARASIAEDLSPPIAGKRADADLARVIAGLKAPKLQTKVRNMPSRRVYRLAQMSSAQLIDELQRSVGSCQQVIVHLINHPRQTIADIAAALGMSKKTIENQITDLRKRGLLETEETRRR